MPATDDRYPALVERALRLIEERGEPVEAAELCRELFGAPGGRWVGLLGQVLGSDRRLLSLEDGRWATSSPGAWPAEALLPLGEGQDEGCSGVGVLTLSSGPHPGPLPEGEGTLTGQDRPVGPSLNPQPSTLNPSESPVGLVVLGTGPKPWRHPIVALGAARRRADGTLERWGTLVRPAVDGARPVRIPAYLSDYGVLASELDEAPSLDRALDDLLDFVGAAPLAGLDVALAVARLQFALRQLGRPPLDNPTIELSVPGEQKPDLARLARSIGLPLPRRPTPAGLAGLAAALADRSVGGQAPGSALGATAWRRLLDARLLGSVPDGPGVYRFKGADGRLLYVGKATSLRSRLASYLTGSFPLIRKMPGLVEATDRLEWDRLPCELAARLREAELIAAERPTYNVQRRAGRALVRARLRLAGEPDPSGRRVPRLELDGRAGRLTTAAAAQAALRLARAGWWPPRPHARARPAPPAVLHRLAALAAELDAELGLAEVGPGLRAADLEGLVVVAPTRPARSVSAAGPEEAEGGWTRERRDLAWPPRELLDELAEPLESAAARAWERLEDVEAPSWEPPEEGEAPGWEPSEEGEAPAGEQPTAEASALLVDPGGVRAVVPLEDVPAGAAELRSAALAALAGQPRREAVPEEVGLAVLATLLAALARREPGVRAWPLREAELDRVEHQARELGAVEHQTEVRDAVEHAAGTRDAVERGALARDAVERAPGERA